VTLAVQNAALSIVMHYSRVSTPPSESYSPASAVLLNELLKGSISFIIALYQASSVPAPRSPGPSPHAPSHPFIRLCRDIISPDCWKLSVPALLYVIQNSLQFVAVSNLPVATFQVAYQMKILTTAAFSVALLRKRLTPTKWLALLFLALGVGIVQIQTTISPPKAMVAVAEMASEVDSVHPAISHGHGHDHTHHTEHMHVMSPLKGFGAVVAACFTSGLAGVYFEMVLKGSKADLWVRNVQLSLFSLIPAIAPIVFSPPSASSPSSGLFSDLFRNFGGWAWATVLIQVLGGLITALVIKYSDNIMKGFATSLSIILSFLASIVLFDFNITPAFVIGASTVLAATWMYNQPAGQEVPAAVAKVMPRAPSFPGSPINGSEPILGQFPAKRSSPFGSPRSIASALGLAAERDQRDKDRRRSSDESTRSSPGPGLGFEQTTDTSRYLSAPYGSPFPSRAPSPTPSMEGHGNRWKQ
jgi:solute carrier family 35 (UDP-sugar transporter), member A1/2/3